MDKLPVFRNRGAPGEGVAAESTLLQCISLKTAENDLLHSQIAELEKALESANRIQTERYHRLEDEIVFLRHHLEISQSTYATLSKLAPEAVKKLPPLMLHRHGPHISSTNAYWMNGEFPRRDRSDESQSSTLSPVKLYQEERAETPEGSESSPNSTPEGDSV